MVTIGPTEGRSLVPPPVSHLTVDPLMSVRSVRPSCSDAHTLLRDVREERDGVRERLGRGVRIDASLGPGGRLDAKVFAVRDPLVSLQLIARRRFFFFQAEDGIRDYKVTGVQTCALPI